MAAWMSKCISLKPLHEETKDRGCTDDLMTMDPNVITEAEEAAVETSFDVANEENCNHHGIEPSEKFYRL